MSAASNSRASRQCLVNRNESAWCHPAIRVMVPNTEPAAAAPLRDSMPEIHVPYMQLRSTSIQPRALIITSVAIRRGCYLPFNERLRR